MGVKLNVDMNNSWIEWTRRRMHSIWKSFIIFSSWEWQWGGLCTSDFRLNTGNYVVKKQELPGIRCRAKLWSTNKTSSSVIKFPKKIVVERSQILEKTHQEVLLKTNMKKLSWNLIAQ